MNGSIDPHRDDAPLAFRYECKYLVPDDQAVALRSYIRPFVRVDRFAASRGLVTYPICSLYLDTADLLLYHHSLHGFRNRFKLRIRSYSDDSAQPIFLEIKRRVNGIVLKRRVAVERDQLPPALPAEPLQSDRPQPDDRRPPARPDPGGGAGLCEFAQLVRATGCRPVIRVRYLREAYESTGCDPVRVTFDTDLRHAVTLGQNVSFDGPGWQRTPLQETILEVKFTARYPSWVRDLLQAFDLQRVSLPKYGLSMTRALEDGRYRVPLAAGLPER